MDYLTEIENILLPAVFISSHEDKRSKAYWEDTIKRWDEAFENDQGIKIRYSNSEWFVTEFGLLLFITLALDTKRKYGTSC